MTSRLLQALGVVLVLALAGAAVGGLLLVKDRVRIVVAADDAANAPDPVALLRDDVATLAHDVAALPDMIRSACEQLEERASARHEQILALRRDVDALRAAVAALPVAATAPAEREVPVAPDAIAEPPVPATKPPPQPGDATPAAKDSFLSFTLPSARFRFDEPQDYTLLPALSRVGFDAKSTLHDFSGVTSQVRGAWRADFDDAQGAWAGEVVVAAATLVTGVEGRDTDMRRYLDTEHHADMRFVVERFVPAANGVDVERRTARGDVKGTMTIRGQSRPLTMPVAIEVDPQQRVVLTGQAPLKLSDYGVPLPTQLGVISMQDEVVVWIALRARAAGGTRK